MSTNLCPVCRRGLHQPFQHRALSDTKTYECVFCGKFTMSGSLVAQLECGYLEQYKDGAIKLSHAIRQKSEDPAVIWNSGSILKAILENPLPRPREQADLLLRWLANKVPGPGETIWIEYMKHGAVIGAKSREGFELVARHLVEAGLVFAKGGFHTPLGGSFGANVTLTFNGWEHYENLKIGNAFYRKAFIAMKFGVPALEDMVQSAFKPAAKRAGFELTKLNDIPKAGLIDDHLRVEIQSSDFVVADLSHDNLGAYWEAGYAEGLGKPVIYTCERSKFEGSKTHFDTNHHLTVIWDESDKQKAEEDLLATIRATLPHLALMRDPKAGM